MWRKENPLESIRQNFNGSPLRRRVFFHSSMSAVLPCSGFRRGGPLYLSSAAAKKTNNRFGLRRAEMTLVGHWMTEGERRRRNIGHDSNMAVTHQSAEYQIKRPLDLKRLRAKVCKLCFSRPRLVAEKDRGGNVQSSLQAKPKLT
jgi:hypothetical protein